MKVILSVICSALPTELTSQLGAGHYLGSKWTREVVNKRLRIYESHIFALRIKTWMKVILALMCTTRAVVKIRPQKKIQVCTGFEPMTSAIPGQRSTNWANKPTGSGSLCWFQINPCVIFELRIKTWMKVILAVMCTTSAAVTIRPEKNSGREWKWSSQ